MQQAADKKNLIEWVTKECTFITYYQLLTLFNEALVNDSILSYKKDDLCCLILDDELVERQKVSNFTTISNQQNFLIYSKDIDKEIDINWVNDLKDFIDIIKKITSDRKTEISFRGQTNYGYVPIPSLLRNLEDFKEEKQALSNYLREKPDKFIKYDLSIDIIKHIQHFHTRTRALDVTQDPLIGLYFAVESNSHTHSELLCYGIEEENINFDNSDKVSILAALTRLNFEDKMELEREIQDEIDLVSPIIHKDKWGESSLKDIEKYIDDTNNFITKIEEINERENLSINKITHEIMKERPHFNRRIVPFDLINPLYVKATWDNERVINQSGTFFLSSLANYKKYKELKEIPYIEQNFSRDEIYLINNQINFISRTNELRKINGMYRLIYINRNKKDIIKNSLDTLNINKARVYPNLKEVGEHFEKLYSEE